MNGRIEEHGLHVWLGYYDNAFRLIRECYDEVDRGSTDPDCPIRTWRDAFAPAPTIGLEDFHDGDWSTWTAVFPANDRLPGEPLGENTAPPNAVDLVRRAMQLMTAFVQSLGGPVTDLGPGLALAAASEAAKLMGSLEKLLPAFGAPRLLADQVSEGLKPAVQGDDRSRRLWHLLDLISAQLKGLVADDLLTHGFRSIDHIEYREWIASHGASPETLDGALVRGLYDLAFSHRAGDPTRTEFPAGLGLFLATKTFFDFRGALFWKMQAGMGDVVIAPIYQALRSRGVQYRFGHRVDDIELAEDGRSVERVLLGQQIRLRPGLEEYDPLESHAGIPCFRGRADPEQLRSAEDVGEAELESFWCSWPDADEVCLERGRDFDELVLAVPVGMAPQITSQLMEASARWRLMVGTLETVGTQAFQLWLKPTEEELGWHRPGSTITSYVDSYDTWSSMTHLLDVEGWPESDRPGTIAYFCSSMAQEDHDDAADHDQPRRAHRKARRAAIRYLEESVGHYWPAGGRRAGTFPVGAAVRYVGRRDIGRDRPAVRHRQRRPVRSLRPGDARHRPGARCQPDDSGFRHLYLAGDWTGLRPECRDASKPPCSRASGPPIPCSASPPAHAPRADTCSSRLDLLPVEPPRATGLAAGVGARRPGHLRHRSGPSHSPSMASRVEPRSRRHAADGGPSRRHDGP